MIIKQPQKKKLFSTFPAAALSKRNLVFYFAIVIVLAVALFTGLRWASAKIQTKGYTGLADFVTTVIPNYITGLKADPEQLVIDMEHIHFQKIAYRREEALKRGLIINDTGSYVPASVTYKGKKVDVKMRLKGHMTDHIQGDKWSYRVKVTGKGNIEGMRLFSLQHPGTRGYIYEWVYHKLLKREGVIALRYKFIEVMLNGRNLGIYAMEENFDEELLQNNQRVAGPLLRFNPDLYWVDRFNAIEQSKVVAEYASYLSSNLEPYRTSKVLKNNSLAESFLKAQSLMEQFRTGKISADSVFDIRLMAKFHAVIDLVGGHHSLDWSDVKFYYNPVTKLLEPIAYESFTVLPAKSLAGSFNYVEQDNPQLNLYYHKRLFSNAAFFGEYIKQLEKVVRPDYLDEFFRDVAPELEHNLSILYSEFPYKDFNKALYYKSQDNIRRMLNPPKSFHAFVQKVTADSLYLKVGMIESLPVQVTAIKINRQQVNLPEPLILASKHPSENVKYTGLKVALPGNSSFKISDTVRVISAVLGSSVTRETEAFNYPIEENITVAPLIPADTLTAEFLYFDEGSKTIMIKPGKWKVSATITIPEGYTFKAASSTEIDLVNSAGIISYSPVHFTGEEESRIIIGSSDSTGKGLLVIAPGRASKLSFVSFSNLASFNEQEMKAAVVFYEGSVTADNCNFMKTAGSALQATRCGISLAGCYFQDVGKDAVNARFCKGNINNCAFTNVNEDAIDAENSTLFITNLQAASVGGKGINAKAGSNIHLTGAAIENAFVACAAKDLSNINASNISISESGAAFIAYQDKPGFGPATITATGLTIKNTGEKALRDKNSSITLNGKAERETKKNLQEYLKKYKSIAEKDRSLW